MLSCGHTFCNECFTDYFTSMINDQNKHDQLKCPEYECQTKPTEEEVKSIINDNCFLKYKKFQLNQKVMMDKNLMFCTTADCEEVLAVQNAVKSKLTCAKCKKETCAKCK